MEWELALARMLHILVFVYWLGGDLGAFYISRFLTDPSRTVPERLLSLRALNAIDRAPHTALILALPTGLTLAMVKGWVPMAGSLLILLWAFAAAWLVLDWAIHSAHSAMGDAMKQIDLVIRIAVLAALLYAGGGALAGWTELPLFIALKLLILAAAIVCGLVIRVQLKPLVAPIRALVADGPSPAGDAAIARVLAQARPVVLVIWALLLTAAALGLLTPA